MHRLRWSVFALFCAASLQVPAEVILHPTVYPTVYVDDNRRLRANDGSGVATSTTDVNVRSVYTRPTYEIEFTPRLRFIRNTSQKVLDAENWYLSLGGKKGFERHQLRGSIGYSEQRSAATELEELGRVDSSVPKSQLEVNGEWFWSATPRFAVTSFGAHTDVRYKRSLTTGLYDYTYSTAGINLRFAATENTAIVGRTNVSLFRTPEIDSKTTAYAWAFGFEHQFSETVTAQLMVGHNIARSRTEVQVLRVVSLNPFEVGFFNQTETSRGGGQTISAEVKREFEHDEVIVDWERNVFPSSLGARQRREEVRVRWFHDFNRYWGVRSSFRYGDQEQEANTGRADNRLKRYSLSSSLSYKYSKNLEFSMAYRVAHVHRLGADTRATSNRLTLSLIYSGEPISLPW